LAVNRGRAWVSKPSLKYNNQWRLTTAVWLDNK
jgi:hypothetical protein